jgi:hypothetical protein
MEDESIASQIGKALVFFAACGAVVFLGWNEPLSYRFKSAQQIRELEQVPEPVSSRLSMDGWVPGGTSLDRAPYEVTRGKVKYSTNYDPKKMGTGSETGTRSNTKNQPR